MANDNVFSKDFLGTVSIQCLKNYSMDRLQIVDYYVVRGARASVRPVYLVANDFIPSGPYVAGRSGFKEVWKLFEDAQEAFIQPVVPTECDERRYSNHEVARLFHLY